MRGKSYEYDIDYHGGRNRLPVWRRIKQLAKMGKHGEIIMDYSIYDAKEAGFDKVVFIIRKDIEEEFKAVIGDRIRKHIDVEYVFQELSDIPEGFQVPEGRTKPGERDRPSCAVRMW